MALAGQQNIAASMFGSFQPQIGPTAAELDAERQRVMCKQHVEVVAHKVRIFNMTEPKDVAEYEKLMLVLMRGTQAKTHQLWDNERTLVNSPEGQVWLRYLEWTEYKLKEEAVAPVGVKPKRITRR